MFTAFCLLSRVLWSADKSVRKTWRSNIILYTTLRNKFNLRYVNIIKKLSSTLYTSSHVKKKSFCNLVQWNPYLLPPFFKHRREVIKKIWSWICYTKGKTYSFLNPPTCNICSVEFLNNGIHCIYEDSDNKPAHECFY